MTDNWQKLSDITTRVIADLVPVTFFVTLSGPLAEALKKEASMEGSKPETLIAEAVRVYLGDAA